MQRFRVFEQVLHQAKSNKNMKSFTATILAIFMLLSFTPLVFCGRESPTSEDACPVCTRVIAATKEMAKRDGTKVSTSLDKYCKMSSHLEVMEEQFCYDVSSMKSTLHRLLDLSADAGRICRKVRDTNPHFCRKDNSSKKIRSEVAMDGVSRQAGRNRGVIFD